MQADWVEFRRLKGANLFAFVATWATAGDLRRIRFRQSAAAAAGIVAGNDTGKRASAARWTDLGYPSSTKLAAGCCR